MNLSKEEIKERNVIAVSIRFYEEEESNVKKYILMSAFAILLSVIMGVCIYIYTGAFFKNYTKVIALSFFSGLLLMWGYYTWKHMSMNKYLTPYVDRDLMKKRIEELGGLDSIPESRRSVFKSLVLWLVITAVILSIFKNFQL